MQMNKTIVMLWAAMQILAGNASAANFMPSGERTSQPIGHHEFCQKNANACDSKSSKPRLVKLTQALWEKMQDVNNTSNVMIEPITDQNQWGEEEIWSMPTNKGDCEDYVLLKRALLQQQGVPAANLLITVVLQPNGEGHAVLAVRTDRGDFILDNLEGKILSWEKTDYRFVKRQSDTNALKWVSVNDERQTIVSSLNN